MEVAPAADGSTDELTQQKTPLNIPCGCLWVACAGLNRARLLSDLPTVNASVSTSLLHFPLLLNIAN